MNTRRQFLQSSLASSALISLSGFAPRVLQAAVHSSVRRNERILVVIQLSGGNDGLNTVIPYGDDDYYRNRFTLAIPQDQLVKLDDHHGLHPSLRPWGSLWENQQLAIIQGVGYPQPNRSHFESMDLWHSAHHVSSGIRTGWLGRWSATLPESAQLAAIHFGGEDQPLALASLRKPALSLRSLDAFQGEAALNGLSRETWKTVATTPRKSQHSLLGYVQENASLAFETSRRLEQVLDDQPGGVSFPNSDLARKLKMVGALIDAGLPTRVYYVSIDGFDTHANQLAAHAGLLTELGAAVNAFLQAMNQSGQGDRIAMMVFSEFGRRVRENASRGTDHGAAAPMFLLGNQVQSGLANKHPSLTDLQDGDLKHQVDYRQVYASVLEDWLGAPSEKVLHESFDKLKLFRAQAS